MTAVVSDTGPFHYLVLIRAIDIVPRLFGSVIVPERVSAELSHKEAPDEVREWIANPPAWLQIRPIATIDARLPMSLHTGKREAIALALQIRPDLLLMDDRAGIAVARAMGLAATGTLGLLVIAQEHGLVSLEDAHARLRRTNFRYRPALMDELLVRHGKSGGTN